MAAWISWLFMALILIGGEIFSGSFYMLPFGLASLVAATVAYFDYSSTWQFATAALTSVIFWIIIRRWAVPKEISKEEDPSYSDIGKPVYWVENRKTGGWRVQYRGAEWDAKPVSEQVNPKKTLYIVSQEGITLIVDNGNERTES